MTSTGDAGSLDDASASASSAGASRLPTDPASLIRSDLDARILAILWMARKAFMPLLWLGLIIAGLYFLWIDRDASGFVERLSRLEGPGEVAGAAFSPFALVVIVIVGRVAVTFTALGATYPFVASIRPSDYRSGTAVSRLWRSAWDRWQVSHAYRSMRWTWSVRMAVLDRLGITGTWWQWWDVTMMIANIVLFIGFFVVLTAVAGQIPE